MDMDYNPGLYGQQDGKSFWSTLKGFFKDYQGSRAPYPAPMELYRAGIAIPGCSEMDPGDIVLFAKDLAPILYSALCYSDAKNDMFTLVFVHDNNSAELYVYCDVEYEDVYEAWEFRGYLEEVCTKLLNAFEASAFVIPLDEGTEDVSL